jgi:hypothetical protein
MNHLPYDAFNGSLVEQDLLHYAGNETPSCEAIKQMAIGDIRPQEAPATIEGESQDVEVQPAVEPNAAVLHTPAAVPLSGSAAPLSGSAAHELNQQLPQHLFSQQDWNPYLKKKLNKHQLIKKRLRRTQFRIKIRWEMKLMMEVIHC